jgi:acyl carrier protein
MEIVDASLVWRVACRDTVFGKSDTAKLLDRIDCVFNDIINNADDPTIQFTDHGVSICKGRIFRENDLEDQRVEKSGQVCSECLDWSPVEENIRAILSSVANVPTDEITRKTTIFHLGLDSISAIKVSSLLRKQSIILPVSEILHAETIPNMAQQASLGQVNLRPDDIDSTLRQMLKGINTRRLLLSTGVEAHMVEKIIPATPGQVYMQGMWECSNQLLFFPNFLYCIEGKLSQNQLEDAWGRLVSKFPILRTALIPTGKRHCPYIQVVLKDAKNVIIWCRNLREKISRRQVCHTIGSVPMSLYASQTDSETIVMLHIHHALYDAVNLPQIIDSLAGFCNDPNFQVSSEVDMSEFVAFSRLNSPPEKRKTFWTDYLNNGDRVEEIPSTFAPCLETVQCYRPALIEHIGSLEETGRVNGLSVQALFLAAYARVHVKFRSMPEPGKAGPECLVIGIYLANRSHFLDCLPDLSAPTLNVVPLRIENPLNDSILSIAHRIQNDLYEIGRVENSCVSLIEIADWTGIKLNTFVNFLKVPDPVDSNVSSSNQQIRFIPFHDREIEITPNPDRIVESNESLKRVKEEPCHDMERNASKMLDRSKKHESYPYKDVFMVR